MGTSGRPPCEFPAVQPANCSFWPQFHSGCQSDVRCSEKLVKFSVWVCSSCDSKMPSAPRNIGEYVTRKWRLPHSGRRQNAMRRRQLDLENNELTSPSASATASGPAGDSNTRNSYVDYDWSAPSKQSESYWVEVDHSHKGTTLVLRDRDPHRTVIYDYRKIFGFFDALILLLFVHTLGSLLLDPLPLFCVDVIYGSSSVQKHDDDKVHFCVKMDEEFLYVLTFLSLLYLFSQFTKKDFLKKFLTSLVKRRRRSLDDIHLGASRI